MDEHQPEGVYGRYEFWVQQEEFYINLEVAYKYHAKLDMLRQEFTKLYEASVLAIQASSRLEADVNELAKRRCNSILYTIETASS